MFDFLKEIFEDNKHEIKDWASWAIWILCVAGIIWLCNHVF
jgi:hypothetical protein